MKKIILLLCMLIVGFIHAQNNASDQEENTTKLTFSKGTNFINAGFLVSNDNQDSTGSTIIEENVFLFGVNASYAYAINNNLFIGLGIGYQHRDRDLEITFADSQEVKINNFNIFPYVRYYHGLGKHLAIFGQGQVTYAHEQAITNGQDNIKREAWFVGIRPGFTYLFSKNIALEINIGAVGYTSREIYNPTNDVTTDEREFGASLNFENLIFGLSYFF